MGTILATTNVEASVALASEGIRNFLTVGSALAASDEEFQKAWNGLTALEQQLLRLRFEPYPARREYKIIGAMLGVPTRAVRPGILEAIYHMRMLVSHPDEFNGLPWRVRYAFHVAGIYALPARGCLTDDQVEQLMNRGGFGRAAARDFDDWQLDRGDHRLFNSFLSAQIRGFSFTRNVMWYPGIAERRKRSWALQQSLVGGSA